MEYLSTVVIALRKAIQQCQNTLKEAFKSPNHSQLQIVKMLDSGCSIIYRFKHCNTFLHHAINNQWIDVTQLLIEKGSDVNCQNSFGETPLHLACQQGLEDEIWMLLFCGADPNLTTLDIRKAQVGRKVHTSVYEGDTCFDIVARSNKPQIQKIFLDEFNGYEKNFNFRTLRQSLDGEAVPFPKLMQIASNINYNHLDWFYFCGDIENHPDLFQLFIQKFAYLLEDSFKLVRLLDYRYERNLETYPKIILSLLDSTAVDSIVDHIRTKRLCLVSVIIHMFDDAEIISQLLCCLLSHGVDINTLAMNQIYFKFGYCDLFRIMLHMDLSEDWDCGSVDGYMGVVTTTVKPLMGPIVPQIIYDLDMSVPLAIKSLVSAISCLAHTDNQYTKKIICEVFAHFALPESVKCAIFDLDPCASLFNSDEYEAFMDEGKFPVVPTLIELCRGGTREYIIKKYQTKNCSQFYTVLKILPISTVYKKIISFETKLYPIDKSHLF